MESAEIPHLKRCEHLLASHDGVAGFYRGAHPRRFLGYGIILAAALLISLQLPAATLVVTSSADSGPGTLRQALLDANTSYLEPATITFAVPGSVPISIRPLSALPVIGLPVNIDATTQPGYVDKPVIELDGSAISAKTDGLKIQGGNTLVRGLAVGRFTGDGIRIENLGNNRVEGCFLGTDATGTLNRGNGDGGISVVNSPGNILGGTAAGAGNLASGSNSFGIYLVGGLAVSNQILGNRVGTDITGHLRLGNRNSGIQISDAAFNQVGGAEAGAGNLISGNGMSGVSISGATARSNSIAGNLIGTDAHGKSILSNRVDGVTIYGAAWNTVGGSIQGAGNVISGNGERGVLVSTALATSNLVAGNLIGLDVDGTNRLANGMSGVGIVDSANNCVGGASAGAGNTISGNQQSGISISGSNSCGNLILGNRIGVDLAGSRAVSNAFNGVVISGGMSNVIGGGVSGAGNVISGNGQSGVVIADLPGRGNLVAGNLIGLAADGRTRLRNVLNGVRVETRQNQIGGGSTHERNVISGNGQTGVYLNGTNAASNRIEGNHVGTDVTGTIAVGNGYSGVGINGAPSNTVGGTISTQGNLVSGNGIAGVYISGAAAVGNRLLGNSIGTDAEGRRSLGNTQDGVSILDASSNIVGGTVAGSGNLISGNINGGIYLSGSKTVGNVIQGNRIGLQRDGESPLGNQWHGIEFDLGASKTTVGGTDSGAGNRIAFTTGAGYDGVRIPSGSTNVQVRANSIFANGGAAASGLGIDLGTDGVTANDATDSDTGANLQQNFPVVSNAVGFATTMVRGSLKSRPTATYTIDVYTSPAADASGYGEGAEWLGEATVTTDATGSAAFEGTWARALSSPGVVTATATDLRGNTSEFSAARTIHPGVVAADVALVRPIGQLFKIRIAEFAHDENGGPISVQLGASSQGAVITADATFINYLPANDRPDSFTYTVRNSFGATATATISLRAINAGGAAQSIARSGNQITVQFAGVSGAQYDIQRSTNLVNWTTVATVTSPSDGRFAFADTAPLTAAFFRLMLR